MSRFSDEFLQELSERSDIVDVVGEFVKLTKRSGANLFGLCPFHNEKTPSFSVNTERQSFHCFGCGKGGTVFQFIMAIENMTFPESVEFLARRAGMELPSDEPSEQHDRRIRLLDLNREAARFFHAALNGGEGARARDYMAMREIAPATAMRFGLGFAQDSFYALSDAMRDKGFRDFELVDAGLANPNKNGRGVHDVFRDRLMFPVIDTKGNVVAFSGRALGDGEPKYLNSRETTVFSKSKFLFALNLAKKSKKGYILLTEGNIDVVSLHQAGFDSAVASLGTSLTPQQAQLISHYSREVVIAYDNDAAGQKAAQRAIGILEPLDLTVRVLQMEGAKDPDEFIKANGRDAFANLLSASENHVEYRLSLAERKHDLATDEGKVAFLKEAAAMISGLDSPVGREVYGMRVAEKAGVSKTVVLEEIRRARAGRARSARRQAERSIVRDTRASVQPKDRSLRYDNTRSALAEEGVIRLLMNDPALAGACAALSPEEFSSPMLGRVYSLVREKIAAGSAPTLPVLSGSIPPEETEQITAFLEKPEPPDDPGRRKALADYIRVIQEEYSGRVAEPDLLAIAAQKRNNSKGYGG